MRSFFGGEARCALHCRIWDLPLRVGRGAVILHADLLTTEHMLLRPALSPREARPSAAADTSQAAEAVTDRPYGTGTPSRTADKIRGAHGTPFSGSPEKGARSTRRAP